MIETIDISKIEITSNDCFVLIDPDYSFVEIPGPQGTKVQLKIVDNTTSGEDVKQKSISGTVLKAPERLLFHGEIKTHQKGKTISNSEYEALMRQSMPHDCELNVVTGDKVLFDYKAGMTAEEENRLFKDVNHGYVIIMPYHLLFAKIVAEDLIPLNGWVFFLRDQEDETEERESGIVVVNKTDKYGSDFGTVIAADKPNKSYIDKSYHDPKFELKEGDRILIQKKFGSRIAYDLYAGKFRGMEAIKRKNILCTFGDDGLFKT